jgi:RecB family exonuclease
MAVTAALDAAAGGRPQIHVDTRGGSLAGTLVHRLFERVGTSLGRESDGRVLDALGRLVRDEEIVEAGEIDQVLQQARRAYSALCGHPALVEALDSGDPAFEVPFSVRPQSQRTILRGTFDCLVRRRDGTVMVLELKTGRPTPEHEQQLSTYLVAARALFPGVPVQGTLVYARAAGRDQNG